MSSDRTSSLRLAVLSTLVKRAPQKPGRTALMKFAYLLQTVKGVALGYRFELYNYGPYDVEVLSDLAQAAAHNAIKATTVLYSFGYRYEYTVKEKGYSKLCTTFASELARHQSDIQWVLDEFGADSASHLELVTTIIFAVREMRRKRQPSSRNELCARVKRIKPYFSEVVIGHAVDELVAKELIAIDP